MNNVQILHHRTRKKNRNPPCPLGLDWNVTCLGLCPVGKWARTVACPAGKSTSLGWQDGCFFAHCITVEPVVTCHHNPYHWSILYHRCCNGQSCHSLYPWVGHTLCHCWSNCYRHLHYLHHHCHVHVEDIWKQITNIIGWNHMYVTSTCTFGFYIFDANLVLYF